MHCPDDQSVGDSWVVVIFMGLSWVVDWAKQMPSQRTQPVEFANCSGSGRKFLICQFAAVLAWVARSWRAGNRLVKEGGVRCQKRSISTNN